MEYVAGVHIAKGVPCSGGIVRIAKGVPCSGGLLEFT